MKQDESPLSEEELLRRMAGFLCASPSEEETDGILRQAGYDPDEVAEMFRSLAHQALAHSPLNWRNRTAAMVEARDKLRATEQSLPNDRSGMLERIHALVARLGTRSRSLAVQYRNLDDVSDSDLRSLLADLEHLEKEDQ